MARPHLVQTLSTPRSPARLQLARAIEQVEEAQASLDAAKSAQGKLMDKTHAQRRAVEAAERFAERHVEEAEAACKRWMVDREMGKAKGPQPMSPEDIRNKVSEASSELTKLRTVRDALDQELNTRERELKEARSKVEDAKIAVLQSEPHVRELLTHFYHLRDEVVPTLRRHLSLLFSAMPQAERQRWDNLRDEPRVDTSELEKALKALDSDADASIASALKPLMGLPAPGSTLIKNGKVTEEPRQLVTTNKDGVRRYGG